MLRKHARRRPSLADPRPRSSARGDRGKACQARSAAGWGDRLRAISCAGRPETASHPEKLVKVNVAKHKTTLTGVVWFRFRDRLGRRWRVLLTRDDFTHFVPAHETEGSSGLIGVCVYEHRLLVVSLGASPAMREAVALHEMMHMALRSAPGIARDEEERVLDALDTRLLPVLRQFGFCLPPEPYCPIARESTRKTRLLP